MSILLFPWASKTTEDKVSPKNYPYWAEVVSAFPGLVHQISCAGEHDVPGCYKRSNNLRFKEIEELLKECDTYLTVDSFAAHLGWSVKKRGIVIFGISDPVIFGHAENINLLKSRKYLRERQFGLWSEEKPNTDAFINPEIVINAVNDILSRKRMVAST